jgi:hypothetical protein
MKGMAALIRVCEKAEHGDVSQDTIESAVTGNTLSPAAKATSSPLTC